MHIIYDKLEFPKVTESLSDGLLAIGGDLSVERLLLAYKNGIFPWYEDGDPILWWSPRKRMVLFFDELIISHSMRNIRNRNIFQVTFNTAFREVLKNCQKIKRKGQKGSWLNDEMIEAYCKLNEINKAFSVEVWQNKKLVGGLYGVEAFPTFCGESMFSKVSNASKLAFIYLVEYLKSKNYKLLDCQLYTDHLKSLGCREIKRKESLSILKSDGYNS